MPQLVPKEDPKEEKIEFKVSPYQKTMELVEKLGLPRIDFDKGMTLFHDFVEKEIGNPPPIWVMALYSTLIALEDRVKQIEHKLGG